MDSKCWKWWHKRGFKASNSLCANRSSDITNCTEQQNPQIFPSSCSSPMIQHERPLPLNGVIRIKARYERNLPHIWGQYHSYSKIEIFYSYSLKSKGFSFLKRENRPFFRGWIMNSLISLFRSLTEHPGRVPCFRQRWNLVTCYWSAKNRMLALAARCALWATGWDSEHLSPSQMLPFAGIRNRTGFHEPHNRSG